MKEEGDQSIKTQLNQNHTSCRQRIEQDMVEVTESNINDYTLFDVVFPIIGHEVKMPLNPEMNKIVKDTMEEDQITMAMFHTHAKFGATSATGSYRKIVARAEQVVFDIVEAPNTNEDLLTPNYLEQADPTPTIALDTDHASISKALRLRFSLRSSSYATMFLREVTRTSSAFNVQHKISNVHNKN
jgi:tRNA pseudouridine13 synthase